MIRPRRPQKKRQNVNSHLPLKVNRVLNIIFIAFVLIVVRLWHLTVVQQEDRQEEARRPQRRTVVEPAKRGTIRDRFNIPLAVNRIQYNAAILYAPFKDIPAVRWEITPDGRKVKRYKRKEYITQLAQQLGDMLELAPERIEDLIYSKAALYNQIPFVIKEDISEQEYYALKLMELQWPGLQAQRLAKRYYPQKRVAGEIIGYMGAIDRSEYEKLLHEKAWLEELLIAYEQDLTAELPAEFTDISQARSRIAELKAKTYSLNDTVGKAGIENINERQLRGFNGKKYYYSDARGNFLKELPGAQPPLSGQRLLLTISSELQEFAEKLLIQNEQIRETRATLLDHTQKKFMALKKPWIKGGAIVVLDPNNGDVLAMASHPRFDPNDFILSGKRELNVQKRSNMHRWLESEVHIAEIWNQQRPYERENYAPSTDTVEDESQVMTWPHFLEIILPADHCVLKALKDSFTVADAAELGMAIDRLISLTGQASGYIFFSALYGTDKEFTGKIKVDPEQVAAVSLQLANHQEEIQQLKAKLERHFVDIPSLYDRVLLADLCRLVVDEKLFDQTLLKATGQQSLSAFRQASAAAVQVCQEVQEICRALFHDHDFTAWRKSNEKLFLKEKRDEEKAAGRYARPYIDLLDRHENELFTLFWSHHKARCMQFFLCGTSDENVVDKELTPYAKELTLWHTEIAQGAHQQAPWHKGYLDLKLCLQQLAPSMQQPFLQSLRSYQQLTRPLLGKYPSLRKDPQQQQMEKHLAAAFYPKQGFGYGRSQAYRQATTQGSLFKLVTAYEALIQKYQSLEQHGEVTTADLNPLEIVDSTFTQGKELYLGYNTDGKPIPRYYKGGRLLRSVHSHNGPMNLVKAIETSSNPYFSLLAGDVLHSPNDLAKAAALFSYGQRTGIDLPYETAGHVPTDLETNRTGLYATAIGQHSLVVTPLQAGVMLATIANGGKVLKPKIVALNAGQDFVHSEGPLYREDTFPLQSMLAKVGLDFPLFLAHSSRELNSSVKVKPTVTTRTLEMPNAVHSILLEGMQRVSMRSHADHLFSLSRLYRNYPEAISDYIDLKGQLFGKTSTAESNERIDLDEHHGVNMYNHVWFGGISFHQDVNDKDKTLLVARNSHGEPELIIIIYLRYGGFGKEAAPLAAQLVAKWRQIKESHAKTK